MGCGYAGDLDDTTDADHSSKSKEKVDDGTGVVEDCFDADEE